VADLTQDRGQRARIPEVPQGGDRRRDDVRVPVAGGLDQHRKGFLEERPAGRVPDLREDVEGDDPLEEVGRSGQRAGPPRKRPGRSCG